MFDVDYLLHVYLLTQSSQDVNMCGLHQGNISQSLCQCHVYFEKSLGRKKE